MPFGLEAAPLAAMGAGIDWMLAVADATARWSEGMGAVRMAPALSLMLVAAGFLWLTLWGERWRFAGIIPILLAVPVALAAPRPDILIDASGEALAARGPDDRFRIIGARGHTFEAETWLRADADTGTVAERSEGVRCDPLGCTAALAGDGADLVALGHSRAAFRDDCLLAAVVVSRFAAPAGCALTATVIDRRVLAEGGAQALYRLPSDIGETLPRFRAEAAYPATRRPFMPPMTGWPAQ
jgi:competence protein ComEC